MGSLSLSFCLYLISPILSLPCCSLYPDLCFSPFLNLYIFSVSVSSTYCPPPPLPSLTLSDLYLPPKFPLPLFMAFYPFSRSSLFSLFYFLFPFFSLCLRALSHTHTVSLFLFLSLSLSLSLSLFLSLSLSLSKDICLGQLHSRQKINRHNSMIYN